MTVKSVEETAVWSIEEFYAVAKDLSKVILYYQIRRTKSESHLQLPLRIYHFCLIFSIRSLYGISDVKLSVQFIKYKQYIIKNGADS